jgi:hypothetical protein
LLWSFDFNTKEEMDNRALKGGFEMRFSPKALALVSALLWGGCIFLVGLVNLASPNYGSNFLREIGSVYPGFYSSRSFADILLGTAYGLVDGAIGGFLFAWLYNRFVRSTA